MRYQVTLSKKGTITLPVAVRKALGLKPGQRVHQSIMGNKIAIEFGLKPKTPKPQEEPHKK